MRELLYIGLAGALGSVGRYAVSGWAYRVAGEHFPYGTLVVNVIGCFLLGFLMRLGIESEAVPRELRVAATVGFLGAFTTFSTFGYETMRYIEDGLLGTAAANVGAQLLLGLPACWGGMALARAWMGAGV
ncbi:MAG: fluoride efflux transporter CrcB [Deltaproteobacteria bacterium]|nr:fluoride efflux transporter CrcB [Deltaproteobacteria bacterium]